MRAEPNLWYRDMDAQRYFLDHFYEGVSFESGRSIDRFPMEEYFFAVDQYEDQYKYAT